MTLPLNIVVGWDDREADFYKLCEYSMRSNTKRELNIIPLNHLELRKQGLFTRPWQIEGNTGQYVDMVDNRFFSTQFSHTRFLVPSLAKKLGLTGFVMFVDCDFIFKDDVNELFKEVLKDDLGNNRPLYVVKHEYTPSKSIKMDNKIQCQYDKKLWSSLMLFNVNHPMNIPLNKNLVNTADGRALHTFQWINDDNKIGSISERWNYIPDHSDKRIAEDMIGAVHYTEGTPFMKGYEFCPMSDLVYETEEHYLLDKYLEVTGKELVGNCG